MRFSESKPRMLLHKLMMHGKTDTSTCLLSHLPPLGEWMKLFTVSMTFKHSLTADFLRNPRCTERLQILILFLPWEKLALQESLNKGPGATNNRGKENHKIKVCHF